MCRTLNPWQAKRQKDKKDSRSPKTLRATWCYIHSDRFWTAAVLLPLLSRTLSATDSLGLPASLPRLTCLPKQIHLRGGSDLPELLALAAHRLAHITFGREFRFLEISQYIFRPLEDRLGHTG